MKDCRVAPRPIRGVLFDMDGVVIDSERLYCRFWMEAAKTFGCEMTWEQALSLRSIRNDLRQQRLDVYFDSRIVHSELRRKRNEMVADYLGDGIIPAKPGIYELLDYLDARGIPAAITSSATQERIRQQLTPLNLYHRFRKICSGFDVPSGKPAPDIYLYGASQLGLDPRECMAVEDSPPGVLSAFQAGCLPVVVPDLDQPEAETLSMVYAKLDSLHDAVSLLKTDSKLND